MTSRLSVAEIEALFELALRAPKSEAEGLWLQSLARRLVEPEPEPEPPQAEPPTEEGEG